jgi:2-polyprenyl-6-methoxyphenol hydroxylase-like FAD-dependent oxidoreductase
LCAAIALRRAFPAATVTIYERAPQFTEIGAGLTLWANAVKALRKLGVSEEKLGGARLLRSELLESKGKAFSSFNMDELDTALGAPSIAVHRAELLDALLEEAESLGVIVQLGAECTGFRQDATGVEALFSNGSVVPGDLLVGADGIRSTVRQCFLPEVKLRYAGYIGWRGLVNYPYPIAHQRTSETWGCGSRFGIVPIGNGRVYWFATANYPAGRTPTPAESKAEIERRFSGWHVPIGVLAQSTPAQAILYNDIYDFTPLPRWSDGRVVLLGDAAHATTPNMGQGACQAIESSVVLARCLSEETEVRAAFQRYEKERKPRTTWVTSQSWRLGGFGQKQNGFICAIRNFVMRLLPDSYYRKQLIQAAGFEV